jgi:dihydrolipoamide dehydrogenase
MVERVLPQYDAELTRPLAARIQRLGIKLHLPAKARGLDPSGALKIELQDGNERRLAADKILVTVGWRARLTGFGLEELDLTMNGEPRRRSGRRCGRIEDHDYAQTNRPRPHHHRADG